MFVGSKVLSSGVHFDWANFLVHANQQNGRIVVFALEVFAAEHGNNFAAIVEAESIGCHLMRPNYMR